MKKGFTLIELLIVIAIIAILALIAIPNFLEAQIRAKVSRCHSDMRSAAVAVETYIVDYTAIPIGYNQAAHIGWAVDGDGWNDTRWWAWTKLTTPVGYLTSIPIDPFVDKGGFTNVAGRWRPHQYYHYYVNRTEWANNPNDDMKAAKAKGYLWLIRSVGPSKHAGTPWQFPILARNDINKIYDPTNGTISVGFIIRTNLGVYEGTKN